MPDIELEDLIKQLEQIPHSYPNREHSFENILRAAMIDAYLLGLDHKDIILPNTVEDYLCTVRDRALGIEE